MNWKGFVAESGKGAKFLKIQDSWIAKQPSLKQFIDTGSGTPRRDAAKPAQAPATESFDEDIPF